MRSSFRIIYFSIALLLLIIILVLAQEVVIQYVVDPITRIIWWLIRILQTIDQKFYWTILIFLVLIFFVYIIPGKNNHKTPSAYSDPPQKEDRMQFWKRSISSAIDNDGDRLILQSNLDLLNKEVSILFGDSKSEPIQLVPVKNKFGGRLFALFCRTKLFSFLIKKNMIRTNEFFVSIQDYLNSLETIMEEKYGNNRNKSSDS